MSLPPQAGGSGPAAMSPASAAGTPGEGPGDEAIPQATRAAELVVRGLSVRFGGLSALTDVSLTVNQREVVGVIGPNGAGKTTLFNSISGLVRPTAGSITYGDRRLVGHRPRDLAKLGIARTLQGLGLWPALTVLENVMAGGHVLARADFVSSLLGLPRSSRDEARMRDRAMDVLARLDIADAAARLPGQLPYAIQKKVALARALIIEPSLILLDEPASGLSVEEMDELGDLIVQLRSSSGVLLVEHHMDFVMRVCSRLVVLNFGEVIATGSPAEVQANPAVIEAYLGTESAGAAARPTNA